MISTFTNSSIDIVYPDCGKIRNSGMVIYGTRNNKSGMQNTEQIIRNGKTLNSISGTGKMVKHGTR